MTGVGTGLELEGRGLWRGRGSKPGSGPRSVAGVRDSRERRPPLSLVVLTLPLALGAHLPLVVVYRAHVDRGEAALAQHLAQLLHLVRFRVKVGVGVLGLGLGLQQHLAQLLHLVRVRVRVRVRVGLGLGLG